MQSKIVQNILIFLERVQLQGNEAEALVEAKQFLKNLKEPIILDTKDGDNNQS